MDAPGSRVMISLNMLSRVLSLLLLLAPLARAQNGDKTGEAQPTRIPREKIPPAPPLSPAEALKTFQLPPGFRLELVASEPLVEMPIALAFDPEGRVWVIEMRGFYPNPDATGAQTRGWLGASGQGTAGAW